MKYFSFPLLLFILLLHSFILSHSLVLLSLIIHRRAVEENVFYPVTGWLRIDRPIRMSHWVGIWGVTLPLPFFISPFSYSPLDIWLIFPWNLGRNFNTHTKGMPHNEHAFQWPLIGGNAGHKRTQTKHEIELISFKTAFSYRTIKC